VAKCRHDFEFDSVVSCEAMDTSIKKNPNNIVRFVIKHTLAAVPILAEHSPSKQSCKMTYANSSLCKLSQLVEGQTGPSHGCP